MRVLTNKRPALIAAAAILLCSGVRAANEGVFADFEGDDYGAWKVEGKAFGSKPAAGTLPGQMDVTGFRGRGLANSYVGGDETRGRLISPRFVLGRRFVTFLIGGGGWEGRTGIHLLVAGKIVRAATGPNTRSGGSERLARTGWDVGDLAGKTARIEIVDDAEGGWGHINVDDIRFSDTAPPTIADVSRDIAATKRRLSFPVKNGAAKRVVTVGVGDAVVRRIEVPLADAEPDWWATLDISAWRGKTLHVRVDRLPEHSRALDQITNDDKIPGSENLYREALRPQFHFSAQRGWLNDPNGLVFYRGEYHLFFQHTPFSWDGDVKYWGQAVSRDLVHWTEIEEALYPDALGAIWSGSAVVDWQNTSGLGSENKPPLVLIYTAAGEPFTQCIAASTDGRTFTPFAGNPVLGNITGGNRDPRVFWHAPSGRWVQALYVEKAGRHTVHFFNSPNLRDWTLTGVAEGKPGTSFLFECPDLFEVPLDGDPANKKWILTGADSAYAVGSFDGRQFTAETPDLPGHRGRGFYAAQTFNEEPRGRRIQIGWFQTETRGMPFNQSMSLPLELRLVRTPDGPRLTWTPIPELESLRAKSHRLGALTLRENDANPLAAMAGELFEIAAEFEPGDAREIIFDVRGVPIVYDAAKGEIVVNGHRAPAPLRGGKQRLRIFADRTGLEVFAADGLTFVPMPVNLDPEKRSLTVSAKGGAATFRSLDVHELRSAWR